MGGQQNRGEICSDRSEKRHSRLTGLSVASPPPAEEKKNIQGHQLKPTSSPEIPCVSTSCLTHPSDLTLPQR